MADIDQSDDRELASTRATKNNVFTWHAESAALAILSKVIYLGFRVEGATSMEPSSTGLAVITTWIFLIIEIAFAGWSSLNFQRKDLV